jgi:hypothetical protein
MARSRGYLFIAGLTVSACVAACGPSGQDERDQLASRATAKFTTEAEHVYYDSLGGAGVTGTVATASGQRNFACLLKPAADSSWDLTAARLLN